MQEKYLFTSDRLGFRNWDEKDFTLMIAISADPLVMEFFPSVVAPEKTLVFIRRMQEMYVKKGYCYFAVDELASGKFIGFIGLCDQEYIAPFTPCVDIGWRLSPETWGKGYATEGAKRCLEYAFNKLKLNKVYATAPAINKRSIHVMQKAGMEFFLEFEHPRLMEYALLKDCICYMRDKGLSDGGSDQ